MVLAALGRWQLALEVGQGLGSLPSAAQEQHKNKTHGRGMKKEYKDERRIKRVSRDKVKECCIGCKKTCQKGGTLG